MLTVGGAISGYCDTGSTVDASSPAIVMMIASTLAKMGRSMKNREKLPIAVYFAAGCGAAAAVLGCTITPGRILMRLSTTTSSPGLSPSVTTQSFSYHPAVCTCRIDTLPSGGVTQTKR